MESLESILSQKQSPSRHQVVIRRLKTYIEKKYRFTPQIDFNSNRLTINVFNSAQAAALRLDLANLNQLAGNSYDIRIKLAKVR